LIVEKEKKTTNVINKFLTISAIVDLMAMSNEFIFYLQEIGKKIIVIGDIIQNLNKLC